MRFGIPGPYPQRRIDGYWDRQGTEIDLVALDDDKGVIRLGTCKRNTDKLVGDLARFEGHIERFLGAMPQFKGWRVEKVAIAPEHTPVSRAAVEARGYLAEDLVGLVAGL